MARHSEHILVPSATGQRLEDCDCACEVHAGLLSASPRPGVGLWKQGEHVRLLDASLPVGWKALIHPQGPVPLAVLDPQAWAVWQAYAAPRVLGVDSLSRDMAVMGFLQPLHAETKPASARPSRLTAWLHLTNACNLRCPYCYLRKTPEHMAWDTAKRAIDALVQAAKAHGYPALKIKYAGGEPFLRFGFLKRLHAYTQSQAERAGLHLEAVVLTNGTLLHEEHLAFLNRTGMALSISLDGLREAHDRVRPFVNGQGSFETVARNLLRAKAAGVELNVGITITRWNLDGIPELVHWLLSHGLPFSLNFYRETPLAMAQDLTLHNQRLIQVLRKAFRIVERLLPPWSLLGRLLDRGSALAPHRFPCGAGHHYLVIDHHGRVHACQMQLGGPGLGTVEKGDLLALVRRPHPGFQNPPVEEKEPCRSCPWRYWCAGGCPLLTYRMTGRFDVKSPYCAVYQALYPEVLRLEALRLLHYAASTL